MTVVEFLIIMAAAATGGLTMVITGILMGRRTSVETLPEESEEQIEGPGFAEEVAAIAEMIATCSMDCENFTYDGKTRTKGVRNCGVCDLPVGRRGWRCPCGVALHGKCKREAECDRSRG